MMSDTFHANCSLHTDLTATHSVYLIKAPGTISGVSRGPCLPYSEFVFFIEFMRLVLARYFEKMKMKR